MAILMTAKSSRHEVNFQSCVGWRTVAAIVLSLALFAGGSSGLRAQGSSPREHQIKAIFIFNFIQFAEWPEATFADASAPIRVGILGDDEPLADALQAAVEGEKIRQRALIIRRGQRIHDLRDCHVIFVSRSERAHVPAIVAACSGRPVLTVGDVPDFARRGGMINFYMEGQKVRFD